MDIGKEGHSVNQSILTPEPASLSLWLPATELATGRLRREEGHILKFEIAYSFSVGERECVCTPTHISGAGGRGRESQAGSASAQNLIWGSVS